MNKVCECFFCLLPKDLRRFLCKRSLSDISNCMLQDAHTATFKLFKPRLGFIRKAIYEGCSANFLTWMYGAAWKPQNENNLMFAVDANNKAAVRWFTKRMPNISNKPYWLAVERGFDHLRDHLRDKTKKIGRKVAGFSYSDKNDKWIWFGFGFEHYETRNREYDVDSDVFTKFDFAQALNVAAIWDQDGNLREL
jgi:hypothetical protein